jgi:two-component system, LytTR family, response regulator
MTKKITCIIIDDEQHCIDLLEKHVFKSEELELVKTFTDATEAIAYLSSHKIDLAFTDIEMPDVTGIDILKNFYGKMHFVVCSAYPQYAIEGFNYEVIDYILKPLSFVRFTKTLSRIMDEFAPKHIHEPGNSQDDFIFVKTEVKGTRLKINFEDITLVEGRNNYIGIRTKDYPKGVLALMNMKDMVTILPQQTFLRVHTSFIVPVKLVEKFEGGSLLLKGIAEKIPIGGVYRKEVLERFKLLVK